MNHVVRKYVDIMPEEFTPIEIIDKVVRMMCDNKKGNDAVMDIVKLTLDTLKENEKQRIIDAYNAGVNSGSFVGTHFVFKGNANDYYKTIKS